jgi:hypothetical protein
MFKEYSFIFYQLFRPFSYLRIKHEDKWIYDWLIPLLLSGVTLVVVYVFIPLPNVIGTSGLINELTDFVSILPGFFIAALAAVATFNKNDIDQLMANPPTIEIMHHGNPLMIEMTRRRFLCVLFSYLTAISIFLVIFTKIGLLIVVPASYQAVLSWIGVILYFYFLWQMVTATILGLYYLGERLHTPQ